VVEACGPGVTAAKAGDRVAVHTYVVCGSCAGCRKADTHGCERLEILGITIDGGFAEYCAVPAQCLFRLPDHLTLAEGAMVEPLANAVAAVRHSALDVGERAVVIGASPIGLLAVQVAQLAHPSAVVVVGRSDELLEAAERSGATRIVKLGRGEAPAGVIKDALGGDDADVVIECTGSRAGLELAMEITGWRGRIVVEGHADPAQTVSFSPFQLLVARSATLAANCGWETIDFARALDLLSRGLVDVASLIAHTLPLEEWQAAFQLVTASEGEYPQVQFAIA
jgi:threonine dehydrogenase-like Zn-dependent dehydrogenase